MAHSKMHAEERWALHRREIALILAFWTFLAVLSVANRFIDPRGPGLHLVPPSVPIVLTLFESALWAALTPLVFRLAARSSLGRKNWLWRLPLLLAVGLVLALAVHLIVRVVRLELLEAVPRRGEGGAGLLPGIRRLWFLNDFIIYLGVLAAGFAREYFRRYEAGSQEAIRLEAEAAALRAQLAEAQLASLRMQLNPHFLFNTLHAISALVGRDPAGVRRMISRLGELLRSTLESGPAERAVEEELAFIRRYLDIMQVRFEGRLRVETVLDPAARDALVPALILQPLVENAVKHGVSRLEGEGHIEVAARRVGDRLRLSVRDSGPGLPAGGPAGRPRGIGLENTEARLRQMYGQDQRLSLQAADTGGAVAEVDIPYRTAPAAAVRPIAAAGASHER